MALKDAFWFDNSVISSHVYSLILNYRIGKNIFDGVKGEFLKSFPNTGVFPPLI